MNTYDYDAVSGLFNAVGFEKICSDKIRQASQREAFCLLALRVDTSESLVLVDADNYRECIIETAIRLSRVKGQSSIVARIGTHRFTVLIPYDVHLKDKLKEEVDLISSAVSKPMQIAGQTIRPVLRTGISLWPDGGRSLAELQHTADIALHSAITQRSKAPINYDLNLRMKLSERMSIIEALHHAIKREEFRLYYQPQIDLTNGICTKAEALLRWDHPSQGLLNPDGFIKIAEEAGLIIEITNWVIDQVALHLSVLLNQVSPEFQISINVPSSYLSAFQDETHQTLDKLLSISINNGSLVLEITEDAFIDASVETLSMLRAIKAKGFLISIDDFGVGYSCLSYLTRLPIDILKVDKIFVEQLYSSKESLALCNAIIHLGKDMGLTVVVEGLETESQVSSVSHSGAHYGQGYFFSKPLDLDSLVSYCLQDREG